MNELASSGWTRRQAIQTTLATMFAGAIPAIGWAQGGPRYSGTFVVGLSAEPRTLNVNIGTDIQVKMVTSNIFNKLINLNSDLSYRPELAKSWTVSPDGKSYTFNLIEGATWHDGKPFTSEDVKFTYEKVLFALHSVGATVKPSIEKIETPDAKTVVFTTVRPLDFVLAYIAQYGYIFPKHLYDGTDILTNPVNLKPVGTGPFKFTSWTRGQQIMLDRNEAYWDKSKPYLDKIVVRFIPDASARMIALEAGEVDYVAFNDLPASAVARLEQNKAITVTTRGHEAWGSVMNLFMNFDRELFKNVKVRQAIYHAVDRQFIIEKATFGLTKLAKGPISESITWAHNPDTRQYPYDVALANKLLDEAGLTKDAQGTRFKTAITVNRSNEVAVRIAQIVSEQLKAVGGDVQPLLTDGAAIPDTIFVKRGWDMYVASYVTGPDPIFGMQPLLISTNIRPVNSTNVAAYRNPKVDELLAKAAASGNRAERGALYKEASAILVEDVSSIWLYENTARSAFRSDFAGLHSWAAESIYNYADTYRVDGKTSRG